MKHKCISGLLIPFLHSNPDIYDFFFNYANNKKRFTKLNFYCYFYRTYKVLIKQLGPSFVFWSINKAAVLENYLEFQFIVWVMHDSPTRKKQCQQKTKTLQHNTAATIRVRILPTSSFTLKITLKIFAHVKCANRGQWVPIYHRWVLVPSLDVVFFTCAQPPSSSHVDPFLLAPVNLRHFEGVIRQTKQPSCDWLLFRNLWILNCDTLPR